MGKPRCRLKAAPTSAHQWQGTEGRGLRRQWLSNRMPCPRFAQINSKCGNGLRPHIGSRLELTETSLRGQDLFTRPHSDWLLSANRNKREHTDLQTESMRNGLPNSLVVEVRAFSTYCLSGCLANSVVCVVSVSMRCGTGMVALDQSFRALREPRPHRAIYPA